MDVLLTGGTGFLGAHVLPRLADAHRVYALARHPSSQSPANVTWLTVDLAGRLRRDHLPPRVDAVVHLAQSRHDRDFPDQAADIFAVNVDSTVDLLEYARSCGARRFVLASSGGVYGTGPDPFSETAALCPPDFYLTSKHCAEALAANYRRFFTVVVLRPFFIYGPGQHGRLIPNLAARIAAGEAIQVAGGTGPRLNPVYVDDAVNAVVAAVETDLDGTFNVGGADIASVRQLAELIGRIIGKAPQMASTGAPASDLIGAIDRLRAAGWTPGVRLEDGLRRTLSPPERR